LWQKTREMPARYADSAMKRRTFVAGLGSLAAVLGGRAGLAADVDFQTWLKALRKEAVERGIPASVLDQSLADVSPIPRVLELDRRQPETTITFADYITRVVNPGRIESGRARLQEHREILGRVGQTYNVQPRFIVALWGIETDFGRLTGNFPVIQALATLAYDGRRSAFFRDELFKALTIVARGNIAAQEMRGSWAGAMGQSQFMPSSYLAFAVDFDGDGRADIWNTRADVFASAANYLSKSGWRGDETWGREVRLPAGFDRTLIDHTKLQKPLSEWQGLGVRRGDGGDLPARDLNASLIQPGGADGPSFLIYNNYRVLLRWNRSLYFATAVGFLADRIGEG
jgi:membrane-bound lytic murein transglycosylase B